jgi:hypothetical protein
LDGRERGLVASREETVGRRKTQQDNHVKVCARAEIT